MPGFNWNGNGKKDSFDHFMDNKVMSETSDDKNNLSSGSGNKHTNNSGKGLNFG